MNNDRALDQLKFIADIKEKAEISRRLLADPRHAEFKALIDAAINYKRGIYESLAEAEKSNEALLKEMIIILTEIKTLRWILHTPEKFIKAETKLIEESPDGKI